MTGAAATDRLRARALARLVPSLGPQWVLVGDAAGAPVPPGARAPRAVVVTGGVCPPGSVRGDAGRIPVQSGAATGVLVVAWDGLPPAARVIAEAGRLLQPGGVVVLLSTWSADAAAALDDVISAAGLVPSRRVAIRRADAAPTGLVAWFPSVEERRAAAATGAERVECAIVARRPGGDDVDLPTGASVLSSMFVPRLGRVARPR